MSLSSPTRTPVGWSRKRKAALVAFALMMTYLHSLYILGFYVTEDEYWWPVWTGMTVQQRLFSYALALFANLGLMVMPFLRAPSRVTRASVALSLGFGFLISVAWLARDLWVMGLPKPYIFHSSPTILTILLDIAIYDIEILIRIMFAGAIYLNTIFLMVFYARKPPR